MTTSYRTCNLCEALCGIEVTVENNQAISIKGNKQDVFSKGHICPKAVALKDLHEDPDRLKQPIQKVNGEWKPISWEAAYELVAKNIIDIQEKYGKSTVSVYQGNPSIHNLGTTIFSPGFVKSLKTKNRYSATSVDQLAHHLAADYMFGHLFLMPVPDINRTDFWLIIGGNPMVSNGSLMTAPNVSGKLRAIQKRGGKVVVIDPRRTETARKADKHLFIRPATDIWLFLAMINDILENDKTKVEAYQNILKVEQIEEIKRAVASFTIEKASAITSIPEEDIRNLIDDFLAADSAICYGRLGVSIAEYGGLSHWAINTLNILTGNFDKKGGVIFTSPAFSVTDKKYEGYKFGRWKSRVRKLPEFGGELPVVTLAEDILTEGEGQVKALITSCGNPVLSTPNGQQLDKALDSLEFMVSVDIYLNETTRHADIILPPATGLEVPHLGIAFHNLAVHNTVKYSEPSVAKDENMRYDWEIFSNLTQAVLSERAKRQGETLPPAPSYTLEQLVDYKLKSGQYNMSLEELKKHPHGIDLGALEDNNAENRLLTADKKIDLFPEIYQTALKSMTPPALQENELSLISRRHLRSNNSWLHNSYRMVKGGNRCTALIHPNDAEKYKIEDGKTVEITSRVGKIQIEAEVSDEVNIGTISIPHGWGHDRKGIKMSIAQAHAGASINDLIDDQRVDELSGVAAMTGTPIRIEMA